MAYNTLPPSASFPGKVQSMRNVFYLSPISSLSLPLCAKVSDWYKRCHPLTIIFDQKDRTRENHFHNLTFFREKGSNSEPHVFAMCTPRVGKVMVERTSPPSSLKEE